MSGPIRYDVEPPSFYERNEKTIGKAFVVLGLAIATLSLGFMIGCLGSGTRDGLTSAQWQQLDLATKCSITNLQYEGYALLGMLSIPIGALILCGGGAMQYRANKREKAIETNREIEKHKASAQRAKTLQTVALMIGLGVALVGIGMIVSSSLLLKHQVPDIQRFIDTHPGLAHRLQENWLDPKIPKLRGLIAGGVFTTLAGGGLMFLSLTGYGFTSLRERYKIWGLTKFNREVAEYESGKANGAPSSALKAYIEQENEGT